jgi:predicted metalloprotease with PDZ domain
VPADIQYTVSCVKPETHYFDVEIRVGQPGGEPVDFAMPVWTPGAYTVHDFAGRVHGVSVADAAGKALRWTKVKKNTWRVTPGKRGGLTFRYRVFALEVDVDKSYLDDQRATINGASVYMYIAGRKDETLQVSFRRPAGWKTLETGLTPVSGRNGTYQAASFDELVDCPVMMGNHQVETFSVDGVPHRVVIVGTGNFELSALIHDTKRIVEEGKRLFRGLPYKHYTFFMEMSPDGYGGLEHRNSTHMIFPRWGFSPRKEYVVALGLISHEFFHTWNVKRLRPQQLGPFDYDREVYTPLLWFAEGFTSYYDLCLLLRAGCISAREYLDEIGRELRRLFMSPGRALQSLEESSHDSWIKFCRPTPDSQNTTISYYNKGCLLALALDLEIRKLTASKKTLDDVMRELYQSHFVSQDQGLLGEDVEAACEKVAGKSLAPLFDRIVRGKAEVDWNSYLRHAGLEIATKHDTRKATSRRPGDEGVRSYLGMRVKNEGGVTVAHVLSDAPAHEAGLAAGDELIALNGNRLDEAKLEKWLTNLPPGRKARFTIARSGLMREVDVVLGERPPIDISLQPRASASKVEQTLCRHWLQESWNQVDRPEKGIDYRPREKIL